MECHETVQEEDFECPICIECFNEPQLIQPCQHTFCLECLGRLREKLEPRCPKCRGIIQYWVPDLNMKSRLIATHIHCKDCNMSVVALYMKQHKMICPGAKTPQELPRYTQGAEGSSVANRSTFKCPYCSQVNLLCSQLIQHCNTVHRGSKKKVVCPVCASMPWGNPNLKSSNFIEHLNMRHRFEYDMYVDFDQDEDAMLRAAIQASQQDT